jgi:cellulose synthase (UDP-forming)
LQACGRSRAGCALKGFARLADAMDMRTRPVLPGLERVLVGTPTRPFADGARVLAGRAQTRWGAWWGRHPRLLRCFALLAMAWMTAYIVWRVGWSLAGANPVLWAMLLVAEAYGLWGLAMLTWFSWRMPPCVRPPATPGHAVDVYVCTYDEPEAVLRATLAGCAALAYPHTTYLLDDGRRPEIAALAARWDAQYLSRADNSHAKAGNINNALPITGGDLVFMLDADHVPLPDALDALIGYFDDERVAVVQTPHEFYNHDSIQHYEIGRHEQSVFYSVICPGKDRHNAAFWCGSGAVLRRSALLGVGGVAVETIAEDFHTTIKLHRAGWKTHYHDEVVVQGLAPHDLAAYLLQRDRWARGNLAVFTTPESPLRARELKPIQRLSYFASLSAYLAGPMRLLMLVTLAAVVWTGELPLQASPLALGLLWAPATVLTLVAGSALCRGYQRIADTTHFELCTAQIFTRALRCIVRPGRTAFKVTPKEGVDLGGLQSLRQLPWVLGIAVILAAGLVVRILDEAGVPLVRNLPGGVAFWVVPALGLFELRRVVRTLVLVARRRQRRIEYRMPLDTPVVMTGPRGSAMTGWARDVCPSGLGLELSTAIAPGTALTATAHLPALTGPAQAIELDVVVQSCRREGATWAIGTSIAGCSEASARRIVEYCYVVSQSERLRGSTPVALPAPFPLELAAPVVPAPLGRPVAA